MKKLLAMLLAMCILLTFVACGDKDVSEESSTPTTTAEAPTTTTTGEAESEQITPLLYKATDDAGHVAWLFGSIHVGKPYFFPLPDYVEEAYESADALAVEFNMIAFEEDLNAQMDMLTKFVYADGTTIKDHIPEELYNDAVALMEKYEQYSKMLDYYNPVMWSTLIDSFMIEESGADTELGIDMYFLNRAKDENKTILEVESAQSQYDMLAGFSEPLQVLMLETSVDSVEMTDVTVKQLEELMETWASGDESEMEKLVVSDVPLLASKEERALYEEYNDAMIVKRNIAMTDYAEEVLASGQEVFICVGAAHIVGDGAMVDLLTERGYTVELVK